MGYYSDYTLEVDSGDEQEHMDQISDMVGYNVFDDQVKWYDHVEDLQSYSLNFPEIVFILYCYGEDNASWRVICRNGKSYTEEPHFDDINLGLL